MSNLILSGINIDRPYIEWKTPLPQNIEPKPCWLTVRITLREIILNINSELYFHFSRKQG